MDSEGLLKSEQDPFFDGSELSNTPSWSECSTCESCSCRSRRTLSTLSRRLWPYILIVIGLAAIIVNLFFWMTIKHGCKETENALPEIDINIQRRPYELMHASPFVGNDYPKVDAAWDELLATVNLRVSPDELLQQSLDATSIELPQGGYLAWLGVFHELHCVKMLRKMNYREHYLPNMTANQLLDHQVHVDHCIDQLRQATMCRADTESLTTFVWEAGYDKPLLSPHRPLHSCADWRTLTDSIRSRVVPLEEIQMATRPAGS